MPYTFYLEDYGPVSASVYEADGITPVLPQSATATIVNQHTGEVVITDAACLVEDGVITYVIPDGSPITANSARYIAYLSAIIDSGTKRTIPIPIEVLDKESYFVVDRWRKKVEFAAPNEEALADEEGRDWIDQAVDMLRGGYVFEYDSTLASVTPTPDRSTIETIASVAALMARTAWWAGKGNWRDEEMSLDTGPFWREWEALRSTLTASKDSDWYSGWNDVAEVNSMYNRDKIDQFGFANEPDDYHDATWLGDN